MMRQHSRRHVLRLLAAVGAGTGVVGGKGVPSAGAGMETDPHTQETFTALLETIIPETPELADELGDVHETGAVTIGLDEFFVTFLNELLATGLPGVGHVDNARLSEGVAAALDAAATELLARGENEEPPAAASVSPGGPFARLSPRDRLRAITLFEEKEFDTASLPGPFLEGDGGLLSQLLVGFAPFVYYSEWAGYDDFTVPRSERTFVPDDVVGWEQVGYPGLADGYAALRGYLRLDGDGGVRLRHSPGEFRENDYDTSEYEDPHPEPKDEAGPLASLEEITNVLDPLPTGPAGPTTGGESGD